MKTRTLVMLPVASTALEAVGYDDGVLYVKFLRGHTMRYRGVPPEQFSTLRCHPMPGYYLQTQVIRLITGFIHLPEGIES